ncbi:leucine zipper domain-containing protein [Cellulomonas sp. A375-1]|uniref:leucine zipper domain-containing protein n=1 Tax=Cellulomonas sp. A375-1 TaxID=1672219 RepID=UPI0009E21E3E|nr:leucine zipper domain-containing protein [Cellulomonas sp. A375-1]
MSKARLVITAVVLEGRPVAQVSRDYRAARSWVYELLTRYRVHGEAAFEPRSRRPHSSPHATPGPVVELIVELRKHLTARGPAAGADTIAWHLHHHHDMVVARAAATAHRARSCASSPSTPPATTSHNTHEPGNDERPNPRNAGSGVLDVLRHHTCSGGTLATR